MDSPCCQQPKPTVNIHSLDNCRKNKNETTFLRAELAEIAVMFFFCLVQLSNLISRNFYCDTMQQYRYSNFSDVFCLNCSFVIDAAAKQLVSGSSLKYEESAVTMAALKKIFFKSILRSNRFIKLAVVLQSRTEWRGPTPRLHAWTTQLRRNVAAVESRWLLCVRFDRPGN